MPAHDGLLIEQVLLPVRQFVQMRRKATQNSRSRACKRGRLFARFIAISCCRSARFSRTSSRCPRSPSASARPTTINSWSNVSILGWRGRQNQLGRVLARVSVQQRDERDPVRPTVGPSPQSRCRRSAKLARMEVFPGISMDPDVRFGKPCLTGTRIDVATIVGALAAGESADTLAAEYSLTIDQVRSALAYVAHVAAHLPPAVRQAS
jgi:uncharacterized protein (DUF433 family)